MCDQPSPHALPRAPVPGGASAGRRAAGDGVRCPTPGCGKKLGERLVGTYETVCPRCKRRVTITR